jgi:hypothetical protein
VDLLLSHRVMLSNTRVVCCRWLEVNQHSTQRVATLLFLVVRATILLPAESKLQQPKVRCLAA